MDPTPPPSLLTLYPQHPSHPLPPNTLLSSPLSIVGQICGIVCDTFTPFTPLPPSLSPLPPSLSPPLTPPLTYPPNTPLSSSPLLFLLQVKSAGLYVTGGMTLVNGLPYDPANQVTTTANIPPPPPNIPSPPPLPYDPANQVTLPPLIYPLPLLIYPPLRRCPMTQQTR